MKVRISKEARILLGLMFAAAAVLVWINFFAQQRQGLGLFGNQSALPSISSSGDTSSTATEAPEATSGATTIDPTTLATDTAPVAATEVTAIDPTALNLTPIDTTAVAEVSPVDSLDSSVTPSSEVAPEVTAPLDSAALTSEGMSEPVLETAPVEAVAVDAASLEAVTVEPASVEAVAVDATSVEAVTVEPASVEATASAEVAPTVSAPTAARDIQLAELPFLVTQAPIATELIEGSEAQTAAEVVRPGEQRASINPFAPIVLTPVEVASVPFPEGQEIVEVPIPAEPVALSTVEIPAGVETVNVPQTLEPGAPVETAVLETPLPEALTPAPEVASLPRPLPGGTLPVAPDILRTMSRSSGVNEAVVEPSEISATQPEVVEVSVAIRLPDQPTVTAAAEPVPSLMTSEVDDLEPITGLASAVEAVPNGGPIAAGLSGLSRYLRDNNVRFTGSVIGPVGVGIFRSNLSQAPYVITLGQTIPSTDIVLTNLQGKQAQFTQGHEVQSLTLDLRR